MATFFDSIVKSHILNSVKSLRWSFYAEIVNFQLLTFFAKKPLHEFQAVLHVKKKELYYFTYFYLILYDFINCLAFVVIKQNFTLKSSNRVNIIRETFILYALLDKVYQWLFQTGFFFSFGRQKKVVTGCIRQKVVLYSNNCTGICLGGLSIGRLIQVVILQRWLFEQV